LFLIHKVQTTFGKILVKPNKLNFAFTLTEIHLNYKKQTHAVKKEELT